MTTRVNKAHTCARCGHVWYQMARLGAKLPKSCPRCKSYQWQAPPVDAAVQLQEAATGPEVRPLA